MGTKAKEARVTEDTMCGHVRAGRHLCALSGDCARVERQVLRQALCKRKAVRQRQLKGGGFGGCFGGNYGARRKRAMELDAGQGGFVNLKEEAAAEDTEAA